MWFFKKKEVPANPLTTNAISQLKKIEKGKLDNGSLEKLNKVIRIFLKEKYGFSRALTTTELNELIKKKIKKRKLKVKLIALNKRIRTQEYETKEPIAKEKFNRLIEDTKKVFRLAH